MRSLPITRRNYLQIATGCSTIAALQAQDSANSKGQIVATCKGNNTIAFVNPETMQVISRITTGEGPHEVCASADSKTAYASIYGVGGRPGNQIAVLDAATRTETKRISVAPLRSPHGIVECKGKIWFTAEQSRCIGRLDPQTGAMDYVLGTGAFPSHMVVLTPDAAKAYTADILDNTVTMMEVAPVSGRPPRLKHIRVGTRPEGIAISPDGREVWAGNNTDGGISIIDTSKDEVVHTVAGVSKMSFRLLFTADGKEVFVAGATGEDVIRLNAATRQVIAKIATPGSVPQGLLLSPDGKWLFTATGQKILKIDAASNQLVGEGVPVGPGVDGMAWVA
jgi:DNA-binding beta-propeller fold protein YncE